MTTTFRDKLHFNIILYNSTIYIKKKYKNVKNINTNEMLTKKINYYNLNKFSFFNKKQNIFFIFYFFPCVSLIYIIKYDINTNFLY